MNTDEGPIEQHYKSRSFLQRNDSYPSTDEHTDPITLKYLMNAFISLSPVVQLLGGGTPSGCEIRLYTQNELRTLPSLPLLCHARVKVEFS